MARPGSRSNKRFATLSTVEDSPNNIGTPQPAVQLGTNRIAGVTRTQVNQGCKTNCEHLHGGTYGEGATRTDHTDRAVVLRMALPPS